MISNTNHFTVCVIGVPGEKTERNGQKNIWTDNGQWTSKSKIQNSANLKHGELKENHT